MGLMVSIALVYRPIQTRLYSGTAFDFMHDFFMPRGEIVAVCATADAVQQARLEIIDDLRQGIPASDDLPARSEAERLVWQENIHNLLNEAVVASQETLHDCPDRKPGSVMVRFSKKTVRVWGGKTFEIVEFGAAYSPGHKPNFVEYGDSITQEFPVLGLPQPATA